MPVPNFYVGRQAKDGSCMLLIGDPDRHFGPDCVWIAWRVRDRRIFYVAELPREVLTCQR